MLYHSNYLKILLFIISYHECTSKILNVATSAEFTSALDDALPGDNIILFGNTTFEGTFIASRSGSKLSPITILAGNFDNTSYAKIVGEDNDASAALTIAGDYYQLKNIKIVHQNSLGLKIEGSDASLEGVVIQQAETAIRIKGARSYLKDCSISKVREGIRLDSDFNVVRDTFVTGEGIISLAAAKESCCGTVMGNVFDGKLNIEGRDYNLFDNVIEGKAQ